MTFKIKSHWAKLDFRFTFDIMEKIQLIITHVVPYLQCFTKQYKLRATKVRVHLPPGHFKQGSIMFKVKVKLQSQFYSRTGSAKDKVQFNNPPVQG